MEGEEIKIQKAFTANLPTGRQGREERKEKHKINNQPQIKKRYILGKQENEEKNKYNHRLSQIKHG